MGAHNAIAQVIDGNLWAEVDLSVAENQTVHTGKCRLIGIHVNVSLSAHAVNIKDNSTTMLTIPASKSAGLETNGWGAEVLTSLVVSRTNASGTGKLFVVYQPYYDN